MALSSVPLNRAGLRADVSATSLTEKSIGAISARERLQDTDVSTEITVL